MLRRGMSVHEATGQRWDTARIEAFSDGVLAIAITLLVLDIRIEPDQFDHLWRALGDEWPAYLAYVTSFLTVAAVWLAHHALFTKLRYVDPVLLRLNLLLLMVAAFLPFPTGLLAASFDHGHEAQRAAVVVYGVTAALIEGLLGAATRYAADHPELLHDADRGTLAPSEAARRSGIGTVLYAFAIAVGVIVLPRIAAIAYLVVAVRSVTLAGREGRLTFGGRQPRDQSS
jgi:uncharacterized membrane protein